MLWFQLHVQGVFNPRPSQNMPDFAKYCHILCLSMWDVNLEKFLYLYCLVSWKTIPQELHCTLVISVLMSEVVVK